MSEENKSPESRVTAKARYAALEHNRAVFLRRAELAAEMTIPSLIPPQGHTASNELYKPFQSLGARGVNNLANKLSMVLLPPNNPFFKSKPAAAVLKEAEGSDDETAKDQLDSDLAHFDQTIKDEIDAMGVRVTAVELFRHAVVAGNGLLFVPPEKGNPKMFPLFQYVVSRDGEGNVLEIIIKEMVSPKTLPADVQEIAQQEAKGDQKNVELYTHVCRVDDRFETYQEVAGVKIPGTEGTYPLDKCPYFALRWTRIDGEDYGRGLCEEHHGRPVELRRSVEGFG
jgi:hypothetical protein